MMAEETLNIFHIIEIIFGNLDTRNISSLACVNKTWNAVAKITLKKRMQRGNASWRKNRTKTCFSKNSLVIAVKHLIKNCYITVGNITMRQSIGIPMGIDPAPFWANLYLYSYEEEFITNLVDSGEKVRARHFHACRRFLLMISVL